MNELFLVTPKRELSGFRYQQDRDYHSKPIRVVHIASRLDHSMVTVRDEFKGIEYPCLTSYLKRGYQLTAKQRLAAGIDS